MRQWVMATVLSGTLVVPGLAQGTAYERAREWESATAQSPAQLADEPLAIEIIPEIDTNPTPDKYPGWWPHVRGRLYGRTRQGDMLILSLSQGDKELRSYETPLRGYTPDDPANFRPGGSRYYEDFELEPRAAGGLVSATGPITATFKYYDDFAEETRELASRTLNVVRQVAYDSSAGVHVWSYGLRQDDLLGSSYLWLTAPDAADSAGKVWLYSWMSIPDGDIPDLSYRIYVDGERLELPEKFNRGSEPVTRLEQREDLWIRDTAERVNNDYNFYKIWFKPQLLWGPKNDGAWDGTVWMADHPGAWEIRLQNGRETLRTLRFQVDADGLVRQHPEDAPETAGALRLGPGRFFVETSFPDKWALDQRFNPEAVSAGVLYGRPWASDEAKAMVQTLPPALPGSRPWPWPGEKLPPGRK